MDDAKALVIFLPLPPFVYVAFDDLILDDQLFVLQPFSGLPLAGHGTTGANTTKLPWTSRSSIEDRITEYLSQWTYHTRH